jgi:hypothetical protein
MSRGFGRIERALLKLFQRQPDLVMSTSELCREVYGVQQIEKKHRVAVLRALKRLGKTRLPTLTRWVLAYERSDDVWFDRRHWPRSVPDCAGAADPRPVRGRI